MIISLLYFGGSILGVFLYTQLDGMAGILLVFYPLFALVYFVIASLNLIFMQKRLR